MKDNTLVIKFGGATLKDPLKTEIFIKTLIRSSKTNKIVLVHGGGHLLTERAKKQGIKTVFVNGIRKTSKEMLGIAVDVFKEVNAQIIELIKQAGGSAVPIYGEKIIEAEQDSPDLEFVGKIINVKTEKLHAEKNKILCITPIGGSKDGTLYNINADDVASSVAIHLKADELIFISDIGGIKDEKDMAIKEMGIPEIDYLIECGAIKDGMVPKVLSAKNAIMNGVKKVSIGSTSIY